MVNRGSTKGSLKAGEEITVTMQVVKSRRPDRRVPGIVLSSGRILSTQLPPEPKVADTVAKP